MPLDLSQTLRDALRDLKSEKPRIDRQLAAIRQAIAQASRADSSVGEGRSATSYECRSPACGQSAHEDVLGQAQGRWINGEIDSGETAEMTQRFLVVLGAD